LVDLLHDGAMAVSCDGTIVATDMTGLRLLGAKEHKDLIGRSIADIFDATFDELLSTSSSSRRAIWELRDTCTGAVTSQVWSAPDYTTRPLRR